jgi:hypothetical protein
LRMGMKIRTKTGKAIGLKIKMRRNWIDLKNENERENENWSENGNSDGIASGNGIKNAKMRLIMGTRVRMRVGLKIKRK